MVMSMPSEELQLLIAGYVLGDLSPEEAREFERLMAENPAIAGEITQMQNALEFTYAPPEVTPPAHLRSTILDKARSADSGITPPSVSKPRKRYRWRSVIEVAAAALIVALGISNYRLSQALKTARAETEQYAVTYALAATKADSRGTATLAVNPNDLEATLVVKDLPPLPPGKAYCLWTVLKPNAPFTTDNKKAILTKPFQVDDRGNFSENIPVPEAYRRSELVTRVAITIEDANAPQKHQGTPIIATQL
jgi:anti-sigma-K factor RskA